MEDGSGVVVPDFCALASARHRKAMGPAVWVYLALRACGTAAANEHVQAALIARRLGCGERTVRRHLEALERHGYIGRKRVRNGWRLWVAGAAQAPRQNGAAANGNTASGAATKDTARNGTAANGAMARPAARQNARRSMAENGTARMQTREWTNEAAEVLRTIFERLAAAHPRGHNPRPQLALQTFLGRVANPEQALAMERDHEPWRRAWEAGRWVPDLHNWISRWEPGASAPVPLPPQRERGDGLLGELNDRLG